jgi:hypothetical protein
MAGGKKMLAIEKELFQWEKGRYVIVNNPTITTVEFYNKKSEYGDEVSVENGQAQVPNKLLKEALPIAALACVDHGDNGTKVISRKTFKVLARPRPEFYIDDDDDPVTPDEPETPDIPGLDVIYDGGVIV